MKEKKLIFATSNKHKFEEARELFQLYGIMIEQVIPISPEIQNENLENIARFTLMGEISIIKKPMFLEDAGLFIEEYDGFPGPYSSFVQQKIGNKGVIRLMSGVINRSAKFRSVVAFCEPGGEPCYFNGVTNGIIAKEERGERMFGYDPIFIPSGGDGKTFSEMSVREKNKFSHRGIALKSFIDWLINERKY